jgi:hypothetical protein
MEAGQLLSTLRRARRQLKASKRVANPEGMREHAGKVAGKPSKMPGGEGAQNAGGGMPTMFVSDASQDTYAIDSVVARIVSPVYRSTCSAWRCLQ